MALSVGIEPTTHPPEGRVISISPRERVLTFTFHYTAICPLPIFTKPQKAYLTEGRALSS